jgi:hypothetical protein
MNRRTLNKFVSFGFSMVLSVLFFTAGSRVLYADFRRTTTVTTTSTAPSLTIPQPTVTVQEPAVVTTQPAAVVVPVTVTQEQVRNYISYDIDVKKIFQSNENVRGDIVVNNASSAPLSDSFHIRLYHNDKLVKELLTRMTQIPPGQTRFSFDSFGIPQINSSAAAQGNWTVSIYDVDPAYSKDVDFKIIQSTNSNNLQR